jgi:hypothetical protein
VQVLFEVLSVPFTFRSGDYWLIPARVATGDVIWPSETATDAQGKNVIHPVAKPPDGVTHHYVALATVTPQAGTGIIGSHDVTPCPVDLGSPP